MTKSWNSETSAKGINVQYIHVCHFIIFWGLKSHSRMDTMGYAFVVCVNTENQNQRGRECNKCNKAPSPLTQVGRHMRDSA